MATASSLMTAEELLALPDDGIDRELIRGELREYPMTTRGAPHCLVTVNLSHLLREWLRQRPKPRGRLYAGDIRVRLESTHFPAAARHRKRRRQSPGQVSVREAGLHVESDEDFDQQLTAEKHLQRHS